MRSVRARLEDLEVRVRTSEPPVGEPDPRDQLRAKLKAISERTGSISDRPDSEEVFAELNARLEVLTGGGR